jgi:hypothetical protein
VLDRYGFDPLVESINSIPEEDLRIKKTLIVFLEKARQGDEDAKALLLDHLAGYMESQQVRVTY